MKLFLILCVISITFFYTSAQSLDSVENRQQFLLTTKNIPFIAGSNLSDSIAGALTSEPFHLPGEKLGLMPDDEELEVDSVVTEYYDKNNGWEKVSVYKPGSETDGNKITEMIYFLDGDTKTWTGFPSAAYAYDQAGRMVLNVVYQYSIGFTFLIYANKKEYQFTYDEVKTEQVTVYKSTDGTCNFVPWRRTIQVFNADSVLQKKEDYEWIPSEEGWFRISETEYNYDKNGNQILELKKDFYSDPPSVHKKEFEYDDNGNLLTDIFCYWSYGTSDWSGGERTDNTYWEDGKLKTMIYSNWDVNKNNWIPLLSQDYEYDLAGNETKRIESRWEENLNEFEYNRFFEYEFDENGNLTFFIYKEWDSTREEWIAHQKMESRFNLQSQQISECLYDYNSEINEWTITENKEYEYNDYGNMLHEITYQWSEDLAEWVKDEKKTYGYDSRQNHVTNTYFKWDTVAVEWVLTDEQLLYVYEYNDLDSIISGESLFYGTKWERGYDEWGNQNFHKTYIWDDAENNWVMTLMYEDLKDAEGRVIMHRFIMYVDFAKYYVGEKQEWKYSDTGQLLMYQNFNWNHESGSWIENTKYEHTYYGELIKSFLVSVWDRQAGDWLKDYRKTYYYHNELAVQTPSTNLDLAIKAYPNPANRIIRVSSNGNASGWVELFDINGRKVLSETFEQDLSIPVAHLKDGLYLLRVTLGEEVFTEKIIIRH